MGEVLPFDCNALLPETCACLLRHQARDGQARRVTEAMSGKEMRRREAQQTVWRYSGVWLSFIVVLSIGWSLYQGCSLI